MLILGDSTQKLKDLPDDSVDLVCTDPPYGYSFMGKSWDKTLPSIEIFKECHRVLRPGAFAFVMSAPRSDVCARMMLLLEDAGFEIGFTPIYWTYASGFPKASNIGKMVDKRGGQANVAERFTTWMRTTGLTAKQLNEATGTFMGSHYLTTGSQPALPTVALWRKIKPLVTIEIPAWVDELIEREEAEREIIGKHPAPAKEIYQGGELSKDVNITIAKTDAAKALDGSYGGFQPKPAVEVIIVAMKPLSEKTYVDQALNNGKGISWLDDCRVPTNWKEEYPESWFKSGKSKSGEATYQGRLKTLTETTVEDRLHKGGRFPANLLVSDDVLGDYSKYFNLDKIPDRVKKTFPFLIVPKASKGEKGKNCSHPTVKPLQLMSYLITLGSRQGDTVLDPFLGSGTTAIAAKLLNRKYIGIEREKEYIDIAKARLDATPNTLFQAAE